MNGLEYKIKRILFLYLLLGLIIKKKSSKYTE